jgi:hypothetical protein
VTSAVVPTLAAATALVSVPAAVAAASFVTPGRAAYCSVSHGEPPHHLICWTPNDGFTVAMYRFGRSHKNYSPSNRGWHELAGRVLRFGETWSLPGYWRCVSRRTGLRCTNRAGHGWWLGRYRGYRLF